MTPSQIAWAEINSNLDRLAVKRQRYMQKRLSFIAPGYIAVWGSHQRFQEWRRLVEPESSTYYARLVSGPFVFVNLYAPNSFPGFRFTGVIKLIDWQQTKLYEEEGESWITWSALISLTHPPPWWDDRGAA